MTETIPAMKQGDRGGSSQPVLLLRNIKNCDGKAMRYPLQKFRLSIGRSPEDDICLSEGSGVSRNHASVLVLDGEVVIEDLGSRNGTYVNRKLIRGSRQTTLKFGDVIAIGRYRLKLVDEAVTEEVNTTIGEVQSLLGAWKAIGSIAADACPLCHEPRCVEPEEQAPDVAAVMPAESIEAPVEAAPGDLATSEMSPPIHGRTYGRKLARRPLLRRRPVPSKRTSLTAAKRSGSLCMGTAGQRAPDAALH